MFLHSINVWGKNVYKVVVKRIIASGHAATRGWYPHRMFSHDSCSLNTREPYKDFNQSYKHSVLPCLLHLTRAVNGMQGSGGH